MKLRNIIFELTPLGKANLDVKRYITEEDIDEEQLKKYEKALKYYRDLKFFQTSLKLLLYASIVTSIAATFGFRLEALKTVASYLGTTLILFLYAAVSYFTMIRREAYHVQREILVAEASR
ncbi:MAG: hypothetical protein ABEJ83_00350 [Candidatus Nanohaloarchaea archaeon]